MRCPSCAEETGTDYNHATPVHCVKALKDRLTRYEGGLNEREQHLVRAVAARLRLGLQTYGPLNDARLRDGPWTEEALEELLDAVVYLTMELARRGL